MSATELEEAAKALDEALADLRSDLNSAGAQLDKSYLEVDFSLPAIETASGWTASAESFVQRRSSLEQRSKGLSDSLGETLEAFEAFRDGLREGEEAIQSSLEEAQESFQEAMGDLAEGFVVGLEEFESDRSEELEEIKDGFLESADEKMEEAVTEAIEALDEVVSEQFESLEAAVSDVGAELNGAIATCLEDLAQAAENEAKAAMESMGQNLVDVLLDELAAEVGEMVVSTQLGSQITMMLQPYLPQIIAANALVPAVQSALDALKMGR